MEEGFVLWSAEKGPVCEYSLWFDNKYCTNILQKYKTFQRYIFLNNKSAATESIPDF